MKFSKQLPRKIIEKVSPRTIAWEGIVQKIAKKTNKFTKSILDGIAEKAA